MHSDYVEMSFCAGRQDAMQRQSLIPISEFMKENFSKDGAGFELLDIASGTGRSATFVKVHLLQKRSKDVPASINLF